jgi:hypothetical protein
MQTSEIISLFNTVRKISGLKQHIKVKKSKHEYANCLERLLLSSAIQSNGVLGAISLESDAFKKFETELTEKMIDVDGVKFLQVLNSWVGHESKIIEDNSRFIKKKKKKGWIVDIKLLRDSVFMIVFLPKHIMRSFEGIEPTIVTDMVLRYSSIIANGQHWALPRRQFLHLFTMYKITHEGFASPLNTGLREFGGTYYSLFPQDAVFGSAGSFFDQCLYGKDSRKNWVINPPFIEDIIIKVGDKILQELEVAEKLGMEMRVVLILPTWEDMPIYRTLCRNQYVKHTQLLKRGKHFYKHLCEKKVVKSKTTIFVLDTFRAKHDYSNIAKYMTV